MLALSSPRLHLALLLITVVSVMTTVAVWAQTRGTGMMLMPESDDTLSAFAVQLDPRTQGIAIINHEKTTLCLYEYVQVNEQRQLALVAVRNFVNDVKLDDYNNAPPRPADIEEILEKHSVSPK